MITVEILGTRFPIPSPFRLPMYYHYLVETLKLLDQWADEHSTCAPALRDPSFATQLATQLDYYATQQMVADINRYFVPSLRGVEGQLASLPQIDFLQYCYFQFCLVEEEAVEHWDGKRLSTYQKDFQTYQQEQFTNLPCFKPIPEALLHPITLLTLRHLSESLWNNLARLCERFTRLQHDLGTFFFGGCKPETLLRATAHGPLRHKGGARSLALTLILENGEVASLGYEPFDQERTFLLTGDQEHAWDLLDRHALRDKEICASLNHLKHKTMGGSSLWKTLCHVGCPLPPQLKVLPCRPGSSLKPDNLGRLPFLRESYGFVQLAHTGAIDGQTRGALAAVAQNMGLEACGHGNTLNFNTLAFGLMPSSAATDMKQAEIETSNASMGPFTLVGGYRGLELRNHKESFDYGTPEQEPPSDSAFQQGYQQTATAISQNGAAMIQWLSGLRDVVVQTFPYPSAALEGEVSACHQADARYAKDGSQRLMDVPAFAAFLDARASEEIAQWCVEKEAFLAKQPSVDNVDPQYKDMMFWHLHPAFCVYLSRSLLLDAVRGDLPSFYHRIGTQDLLGSDGSMIRFALHNIDSPLVVRALNNLYGNAWQSACPYFPRDSMAVLVEHVRRLAEDKNYFQSFVQGFEKEPQGEST